MWVELRADFLFSLPEPGFTAQPARHRRRQISEVAGRRASAMDAKYFMLNSLADEI